MPRAIGKKIAALAGTSSAEGTPRRWPQAMKNISRKAIETFIVDGIDPPSAAAARSTMWPPDLAAVKPARLGREELLSWHEVPGAYMGHGEKLIVGTGYDARQARRFRSNTPAAAACADLNCSGDEAVMSSMRLNGGGKKRENVRLLLVARKRRHRDRRSGGMIPPDSTTTSRPRRRRGANHKAANLGDLRREASRCTPAATAGGRSWRRSVGANPWGV